VRSIMGYGMFEWMGRSADGMSYRSNEESHFGAFGPISGVFSTPTVTCICMGRSKTQRRTRLTDIQNGWAGNCWE
jgi:hypothetical protein